ncbi:MAG: RnfABCDGE type electron transport complex subunit C [Methanocellales archaeon]|nr:RnfABCDGE type electron transport complex subunit C [Methanocellales archaeon]
MKQITVMNVPEKVIIPVNDPLVKVGDMVNVGQKIGEKEHSSVSGEVIEISKLPHPSNKSVSSVVIKTIEDVSIEFHQKDNPSPNEIKKIINEAGIPIELSSSEIVILNGTDEKPYVTSNRAQMLEYPDKLLRGLKILMKATGASRGVIVISDNDSDVIESMKAAKNEKGIDIIPSKTNYTQCAEGLMKSAIGKDATAIVSTIGIAKAVYDAVSLGRPLIDTVITVKGAKEEKNVLVKIGTPLRIIIENCGGYRDEPKKIIVNGPMTGTAQYTDEVPITKNIYGIFVQYDGMIEEIRPCIDCARCVDVCPKNLLPNFLAISADNARFEFCLKYRLMDCIECGFCANVCPSKIPIVQLIKYAKSELGEQECN